jgi:hypothetical protein
MPTTSDHRIREWNRRIRYRSRTLDFQPSRCVCQPIANLLRRLVATEELGYDRRRHDRAAIERRQNMLVLDENQMLQRRRVSDDNHSKSGSAVRMVRGLSLTLLSQLNTGFALTLEVLD